MENKGKKSDEKNKPFVPVMYHYVAQMDKGNIEGSLELVIVTNNKFDKVYEQLQMLAKDSPDRSIGGITDCTKNYVFTNAEGILMRKGVAQYGHAQTSKSARFRMIRLINNTGTPQDLARECN